MRYGASPEAWAWFVDLGLTEDLLPVISDPAVEPSPGSALKAFGKVPSMVNGDGRGHGIAKWTQHRATAADIARWSRDDRHGICVIARRLRAIDIDVEDEAKARAIQDTLCDLFGRYRYDMRFRYRNGSGKVLLPFWFEGELPKRVLPVDGGIVEILGESQQWVAAGTHPKGQRYEWSDGAAFPTLDADGLERLWDALVLLHGVGEPRIARTRLAGSGGDGAGLDEVGRWLLDNWPVNDVDGGTIYVECPFADEHTTEDASGTRTAYFSAGTGGYEQGHFRCLGAHCEGRTDSDFLDATGYALAQFSGVPAVVDVGDKEPLQLTRDKTGILPTADNLLKLCSAPSWIHRVIAFDAFANALVWCEEGEAEGLEQWQPFTDEDTFDVRVRLEQIGVKPMSPELLRAAIARAAKARTIDTAQVWLGRLRWDGVPRVASFATIAWGWAPGDYAEAVSRYVWTALAGRVLEPGCQADMAPVLVGAQGLRKTSAIKAMVPDASQYATLSLESHGDNTARLLRGKLVGELEELRGLNSSAIEGIKAWITKTHESWIVKFKEFETSFARRLLFFGTTNEDEFLNDPTGERRFLPGKCGKVDVDWIVRWRDQLWAEGAARFMLEGVEWQDAERLAKGEHDAFKISDAWEQPVARWLAEPDLAGVSPASVGVVQPHDALTGAVGVPAGQHDRARVLRMGKVLSALGWKPGRVYADGQRVRAWLKEPSS